MESNKLARRQALKAILAAAGGLTAAAFLPSKWLKPVVNSGVLPAHAQTSAHSMMDANQSGSTSSNVQVYVYNGTVVQNVGVGIGAGALGTSSLPGTPVPGLVVSMTAFDGKDYYVFFSLNGDTSIPVQATTGADGIAHFGELLFSTKTVGAPQGSNTVGSSNPGSVTLTFEAPGCSSFNMNVDINPA